MAESIKCPNCGENNPPDQENCRKCNSPLQPFGVANPAFKPGQIPTKKNTAELEPILPQWLKDARDQARQTVLDDSGESVKPPPAESHSPASGLDLLAGLQSQKGDDEEETPDWLASITGVSTKSKKQESDPSDVRWVELGGKEETPDPLGGGEDENPSWLKNLQAQPADETDELQGWLGQSAAVDETKDASPAWLNPTGVAETGSSDDAPDWLKQMDAPVVDDPLQTLTVKDSSIGDAPDWLRQMNSDSPEASTPDVPVWSNDSGAGATAFTGSVFGEAEAGLSSTGSDSDDDWLKGLQEKQVGDSSPAFPSSSTPALEESEIGAPADEPIMGDIPSWLKAAAPQSSIFSDAAPEQNDVSAGDTPEWLAAFRADSSSPQSSPFESNEPESADTSAPAFADGSFAGNSDVLFSDMPDWLSGASSDASKPAEPETTASADSIAPSNLPSWVQAMRPVDTGAVRSGPLSTDQTLETRGALAGLQGVLPAVPGYAPSSKPKAYSIKLQATDEQQAHALLLEQILAAETEPQPIASFSPLIASRALRLILTSIFFLILPAVLFLRTQLFLTPFVSLDTSNSFSNALVAAQNVPQAAPVLVVMDYQPATLGEMEAAAAPMFDHMYLLHHPRLVFVSTNEMGTVLAERFIAILRDNMDIYKDDATQLTNLGYLPGGEMGIRAFIQNPLAAMPSGVGVLQQNIPLTQFATVIVMTDNASSARAWVEQTTSSQYPFPVVFVSSAQSAPMIQPYYDSGQVTGIVSGLRDGAVFEQVNVGRPGTARNYWDAYSIGILLAVALITGGGLWNLFAGLRNRSLTGVA